MLRAIRFQCAGIWIPTAIVGILAYIDGTFTHFRLVKNSTCAGPSGMKMLPKSSTVCTRL